MIVREKIKKLKTADTLFSIRDLKGVTPNVNFKIVCYESIRGKFFNAVVFESDGSLNYPSFTLRFGKKYITLYSYVNQLPLSIMFSYDFIHFD